MTPLVSGRLSCNRTGSATRGPGSPQEVLEARLLGGAVVPAFIVTYSGVRGSEKNACKKRFEGQGFRRKKHADLAVLSLVAVLEPALPEGGQALVAVKGVGQVAEERCWTPRLSCCHAAPSLGV